MSTITTQTASPELSRRDTPDGVGHREGAQKSSTAVRSFRRRWVWVALTLVATCVAALLPLFWDSRFYFKGDTQVGAFGQWVHLGRELRAGRWPLLDLQSWRAGNFVSEGQWGLYSPLTLAVALLASVARSAVLFCTLLKLGLLMLCSAGTYLLARSYSASQPAAFVAGVAVTLGGVTVYLDSPSWVTGQMVLSLLPFCWWGIRRAATGANPLPALAASYLIVTVGYVYGTLYLGLVLVACMLDSALARDRRAVLRVVLVGVVAALVAVAVYLPGVLTASVTTRAGFAVVSEGRLQGNLAGLLTSMLPTDQQATPGKDFPTHYVAWFLPVVLWLDPARVRARARPLAGLLLVLALGVLWVLGPNAVGPIRWPVRVLPLVVLAVVVLVAVLVDGALRWRPRRDRLVLSTLWVLTSVYLVTSRHWDIRHVTWVSGSFVLVGLVGCWFLVRRPPSPEDELGAGWRSARGTRAVLACFVVAWSLLGVVVQHHYFPGTPAVDRNMPSRVAAYSSAASAATGDTMVIGDPEAAAIADPAVTQDFLFAGSWFVGPHPVQSVYTTIGFSTYNARYCIRYNGTTCTSALSRLLQKEPSTGVRRIDLLSISSLQIYRPGLSTKTLMKPPSGWHVAYQSRFAVTWVRDVPEPSAGGVVWSSAGTAVTAGAGDARHARFTVDRVPAGGGTVVLSRLAWPGYTVKGAELAPSTDGYLVTLRVPGGSTGRQVEVDFAPPGWAQERAALGLGLGLGLGWSLVVAARRLRRLRAGSARP